MDFGQVRTDPDLEFLRADARFEVRGDCGCALPCTGLAAIASVLTAVCSLILTTLLNVVYLCICWHVHCSMCVRIVGQGLAMC